MDYNEFYREWKQWPDSVSELSMLPEGTETVSFYRQKNSHKGIHKLVDIKELSAKQVNQGFLEEIGRLNKLERLHIEVLTAESLEPLTRLDNLRFLRLGSVRNVREFGSILELKSLEKLFIENAKYLNDVEFLRGANNLIAIGVEGGMYKQQKVDSLEPFSKLNTLEALFMSSVQLRDKNLDYLATIPNLKYLGSARFAQKSSFTSLRKLMPELTCRWCDVYEV
ncbi:MAG: hypothetical protein K6L80_07950 [Agarilytica sp.]